MPLAKIKRFLTALYPRQYHPCTLENPLYADFRLQGVFSTHLSPKKQKCGLTPQGVYFNFVYGLKSSTDTVDDFFMCCTFLVLRHILGRGDVMNKNSCPNSAVANIKGGEKAPTLCGRVKFEQMGSYVLVSAKIKGLPQNGCGFFGFHIHEGDSCDGSDFSDTGSHYNPTDGLHPTHAGDLPPLMFCNGGACMTVATDRFTVKDIIGRTVVIHSMPDDFTSQPAGNAGTKIACGVINSNLTR